MSEIKRISFSELKNWKECPYRHKLIYIDKLPNFEGNEFTAFGTAIHAVCEETIPTNSNHSYVHTRVKWVHADQANRSHRVM